MNIRYRVELNDVERDELRKLIAGGNPAARKVKRAQILLALDQARDGQRLTDEQVAAALAVGTSTIYRVKRRLVELGLEAALAEEKRAGAARMTTAQEDAKLIALACTEPPEGHSRWTLQLLWTSGATSATIQAAPALGLVPTLVKNASPLN